MEPTNPVVTIFSMVLLPPLIAILKQQGFSPQVNAMIALGVYAAVGIAAAVMEFGVPVLEEPLQVINFIASVGISGTFAYKLFWSNIGKTTENAPSIEERITEATSVVK